MRQPFANATRTCDKQFGRDGGSEGTRGNRRERRIFGGELATASKDGEGWEGPVRPCISATTHCFLDLWDSILSHLAPGDGGGSYLCDVLERIWDVP